MTVKDHLDRPNDPLSYKLITEARHQHCRLLEAKLLTMISRLLHMIAGGDGGGDDNNDT